MKLVRERFVQVMDSDQEDDVAEVIIAPGREIELDELRQGHHADLLDLLTYFGRVWEREGGRFIPAGVIAGEQEVHTDPVLAVHEPSRPVWHLIKGTWGEFVAEPGQSLGREQDVDVLGGPLGAVGVDGHRPHHRIRNAGLVQLLRHAPHRLVDFIAFFEEHIDFFKSCNEIALLGAGVRSSGIRRRPAHGSDLLTRNLPVSAPPPA